MSLSVADLIAKLGLDLGGFEEGLKRGRKSLDDFGRNLSGVGKDISKSLTLPIGAMATAATAAGITFDNALDKIRLGTGATGKAAEQLERDFREVFKSLPTSAGQASSAIANLNTRLGLSGKPLQDITTAFLNLARATEQDVNPLIREGTRLFANWGVATEDQGRLLDHFFKVSQATGVGVGELLSQVRSAGVTFQTLGFSVEETASMFGMFEKVGIDAQSVAFGLQRSMDKLTEGGKTAREGFDALIKSVKDADTNEDALAQTSGILSNRIALNLVKAVRSGGFEFDAFNKSILANKETVAGALKDTDGFVEMMIKLKNAVTTALEPLGTELLRVMEQHVVPMFEAGAAALGKVVRAFMDLPEPVRVGAIALAALAASLGPLMLGAGAMLPVLSSVIGGIASVALPGLVVAVKAASVAFAFLAANPLILVAAALLALIPILNAVGGAWDANTKRIRDAVDEYHRLNLAAPGAGDALVRLQQELDRTFDPRKRAELQRLIDGFRALQGSAVDAAEGVTLGKLAIDAMASVKLKGPFVPSPAELEALDKLRDALRAIGQTDAQNAVEQMTEGFKKFRPPAQAMARALAEQVVRATALKKALDALAQSVIAEGKAEDEGHKSSLDFAQGLTDVAWETKRLTFEAKTTTEALDKLGKELDQDSAELADTSQDARAFGRVLDDLAKETHGAGIELQVVRLGLGRLTPATEDQVAALQRFGRAYQDLAPHEQEAIRRFTDAQRELKLYRGALDFVKAGYDEQTATALAHLRMQAEHLRGFFDAFQAGALDWIARGKSMWDSFKDISISALTTVEKNLSQVFFDVMTSKTRSFTEVMEQLWKGMLRSVLQGIADFMAQVVVREFLGLVLGGGSLSGSLGLGSGLIGALGGLLGNIFHQGGTVPGTGAQPALLAGGEVVVSSAVARMLGLPSGTGITEAFLANETVQNALTSTGLRDLFGIGGTGSAGADILRSAGLPTGAFGAGGVSLEGAALMNTEFLGSAASSGVTLPGLGTVLSAAGIALNTYNAIQAFMSGNTGAGVGGVGGMIAGGFIGNLLVPGLGGILGGAAIGGGVGGFLGGLFGGGDDTAHAKAREAALQAHLATGAISHMQNVVAGGFQIPDILAYMSSSDNLSNQGFAGAATAPFREAVWAKMVKTLLDADAAKYGREPLLRLFSPEIVKGYEEQIGYFVDSGQQVRWWIPQRREWVPLGVAMYDAAGTLGMGGQWLTSSTTLRDLGDQFFLSDQAGSRGIPVPEGIEWLQGFAHGGSFHVPGSGGADSQLVSFMATPGEQVDVTPAGQEGGDGGRPILLTVQLDGRTLFDAWVKQARSASRSGRKFLEGETVVVKARV